MDLARFWLLRLHSSQLGPLLIHPLFFFGHNYLFGAFFRLFGERMVHYETSSMQRCVSVLSSARVALQSN